MGRVTAALLPIAVPLAVLSLPFLDMVLAVVRRTVAGKNPWDADRKHLHHRMLELGHGHRNAVLILYMWAALLALGHGVVRLRRGLARGDRDRGLSGRGCEP